jgi:CBS domain-containing protein
MDAYRLHGLVVIDDEHKVVGVISQSDLLRVRALGDWPQLTELAVSHMMTMPAITVSIDASLDEAAKIMKGRRIHRLVVIGADHTTPVGVLSVSDLVHRMTGEEGPA